MPFIKFSLPRTVKSFCLAVVTTCSFGAVATPVTSETYPFSFIKCGVIACVDVYQGEGVSYPQLIVHIWPKGGGLNSIDYTYIADYNPNGSGAFQLYLGNTLIEHHSPDEVVYLPENLSEGISPYGIYLSEGMELAFNSPYTAEYNWWPSQNVINEIATQSVDDIPSVIHDWDNLNGPNTPGGSNGNGAMSDQAIGGLADPERLCELTSPFDSTDHCSDQAIGGVAGVGGIVAVISPEAKATAIRTRFAPVLAASRAASLARLNRTIARFNQTLTGNQPAVQSGGSNCSNLLLVDSYASGGLTACFESCDLCVQQDIEDWTWDVGKACGQIGVGTAIIAALATEGLAVAGAVSITAGVSGLCAAPFLNNLTSMRMMRRTSCLNTCEYLDALAND